MKCLIHLNSGDCYRMSDKDARKAMRSCEYTYIPERVWKTQRDNIAKYGIGKVPKEARTAPPISGSIFSLLLAINETKGRQNDE
jgi:hypothetical protein